MTVQPVPTATPTLADLLAAFLVALSGDDVVALHEAEAAMLHGYRLRAHTVPPIALLCDVARRLRRCELAMPVVERNGRRSRGPDGHAFGAARLAIEMRLEQILEEMMRARPAGRPVSLADPAEALAAVLGKDQAPPGFVWDDTFEDVCLYRDHCGKHALPILERREPFCQSGKTVCRGRADFRARISHQRAAVVAASNAEGV